MKTKGIGSSLKVVACNVSHSKIKATVTNKRRGTGKMNNLNKRWNFDSEMAYDSRTTESSNNGAQFDVVKNK